MYPGQPSRQGCQCTDVVEVIGLRYYPDPDGWPKTQLPNKVAARMKPMHVISAEQCRHMSHY